MKETIEVMVPSGARWRTMDADGSVIFWSRRPKPFNLKEFGEPWSVEYDRQEGFWIGHDGTYNTLLAEYRTGIRSENYRGTLKRLKNTKAGDKDEG